MNHPTRLVPPLLVGVSSPTDLRLQVSPSHCHRGASNPTKSDPGWGLRVNRLALKESICLLNGSHERQAMVNLTTTHCKYGHFFASVRPSSTNRISIGFVLSSLIIPSIPDQVHESACGRENF